MAILLDELEKWIDQVAIEDFQELEQKYGINFTTELKTKIFRALSELKNLGNSNLYAHIMSYSGAVDIITDLKHKNEDAYVTWVHRLGVARKITPAEVEDGLSVSLFDYEGNPTKQCILEWEHVLENVQAHVNVTFPSNIEEKIIESAPSDIEESDKYRFLCESLAAKLARKVEIIDGTTLDTLKALYEERRYKALCRSLAGRLGYDLQEIDSTTLDRLKSLYEGNNARVANKYKKEKGDIDQVDANRQAVFTLADAIPVSSSYSHNRIVNMYLRSSEGEEVEGVQVIADNLKRLRYALTGTLRLALRLDLYSYFGREVKEEDLSVYIDRYRNREARLKQGLALKLELYSRSNREARAERAREYTDRYREEGPELSYANWTPAPYNAGQLAQEERDLAEARRHIPEQLLIYIDNNRPDKALELLERAEREFDFREELQWDVMTHHNHHILGLLHRNIAKALLEHRKFKRAQLHQQWGWEVEHPERLDSEAFNANKALLSDYAKVAHKLHLLKNISPSFTAYYKRCKSLKDLSCLIIVPEHLVALFRVEGGDNELAQLVLEQFRKPAANSFSEEKVAVVVKAKVLLEDYLPSKVLELLDNLEDGCDYAADLTNEQIAEYNRKIIEIMGRSIDALFEEHRKLRVKYQEENYNPQTTTYILIKANKELLSEYVKLACRLHKLKDSTPGSRDDFLRHAIGVKDGGEVLSLAKFLKHILRMDGEERDPLAKLMLEEAPNHANYDSLGDGEFPLRVAALEKPLSWNSVRLTELLLNDYLLYNRSQEDKGVLVGICVEVLSRVKEMKIALQQQIDDRLQSIELSRIEKEMKKVLQQINAQLQSIELSRIERMEEKIRPLLSRYIEAEVWASNDLDTKLEQFSSLMEECGKYPSTKLFRWVVSIFPVQSLGIGENESALKQLNKVLTHAIAHTIKANDWETFDLLLKELLKVNKDALHLYLPNETFNYLMNLCMESNNQLLCNKLLDVMCDLPQPPIEGPTPTLQEATLQEENPEQPSAENHASVNAELSPYRAEPYEETELRQTNLWRITIGNNVFYVNFEDLYSMAAAWARQCERSFAYIPRQPQAVYFEPVIAALILNRRMGLLDAMPALPQPPIEGPTPAPQEMMVQEENVEQPLADNPTPLNEELVPYRAEPHEETELRQPNLWRITIGDNVFYANFGDLYSMAAAWARQCERSFAYIPRQPQAVYFEQVVVMVLLDGQVVERPSLEVKQRQVRLPENAPEVAAPPSENSCTHPGNPGEWHAYVCGVGMGAAVAVGSLYFICSTLGVVMQPVALALACVVVAAIVGGIAAHYIYNWVNAVEGERISVVENGR